MFNNHFTLSSEDIKKFILIKSQKSPSKLQVILPLCLIIYFKQSIRIVRKFSTNMEQSNSMGVCTWYPQLIEFAKLDSWKFLTLKDWIK